MIFNRAEPSNLDNLPIEVLLMILGHLNLNQIKDLRLVCRTFRDSIRYHLVRDLIVFNSHKFDPVNCWALTNESIDEKICLPFNTKRRFFDCDLFQFKYLRRLKIISAVQKINFKFEDLDRFCQLEHLDLNLTCFNTQDEHLDLPRLKIFSLESSKPIRLTCELSSLQMFRTTQSFEFIEFRHNCASLRHLELNSYHKSVRYFQGLQVLKLVNLYNVEMDILKLLPELKEIHFHCSFDSNSYISFCSFYDYAAKLITYIHKQRLNLNRGDVKLFIFGVEFVGDQGFGDYDFKQLHNLLIFRNYHQLSDSLPFVTAFKYNELLATLQGVFGQSSLPENFFIKFPNIQRIQNSGRIKMQNDFLDFIIGCRNLNDLTLLNCGLNADFYQQLFVCSPTLNKLKFAEENDCRIHYEFIFHLKLLRRLVTNQDLSMNSVLAGLKSSSFLRSISFRNRRDEVTIGRHNGVYYLDFREQPRLVLNEKGEEVIKKGSLMTKTELGFESLLRECQRLETRAGDKDN